MTQPVLVTGGAGFIGSHLVEALAAEGRSVRVLDDLSTGRAENLTSAAAPVDLRRGDVRDREAVAAAVSGCDLVYHLAAQVSVPASVERPQESHDVNLQGTLNVLTAARAAGVRRVVLASSAAVYGDRAVPPTREDAPLEPCSPYAVQKLASEHYLGVFHRLYGLEGVALRFFNVYGPRQDPSSPYSGVISIFVSRLRAGVAPTVFGDGGQTRDFVYVEDIVAGLVHAGRATTAPGAVYNLGTGERTSLLDLLQALQKSIGCNLVPRFAPPRAGDVRESCADISRACRDLEYRPRVRLAEGIARLVASGGGGSARTGGPT